MVKRIESFSANTYQSGDGSNLTIAGFEEKIKSDKASASVYIAGGGRFAKPRSELMFVMDLKGSCNYDKKGIFNQNLRLRTKFGGESMSAQVRYSPLSINVPIDDKKNIYLNPHHSGEYDFSKNKWKNSAGAFVGANHNFGKVSVYGEVQRYNLQDIKDNSMKNWGINAGVSYTF